MPAAEAAPVPKGSPSPVTAILGSSTARKEAGCWSGGPGEPNKVARIVALRIPFGAEDLALGPRGTFYVAAPGRSDAYPENVLRVSRLGRVLWSTPAYDFGYPAGKIRTGPGNTLYAILDKWQPVATAAGAPVSPLEQFVRAGLQPLPHGERLATVVVSSRRIDVALISRTSQLLRAWRITSTTPLAADEPPALVGGDPAFVFQVGTWPHKEYLFVRLGPRGGTRSRFAIPAGRFERFNSKIRIGPRGYLYHLDISATGARILRYSLAPNPAR